MNKYYLFLIAGVFHLTTIAQITPPFYLNGGRIGINTIGPAGTLEIATNVCNLSGETSLILTNKSCLYPFKTGNFLRAQTLINSTLTTKFLIDASGKTGINLGSSLPVAQLEVRSMSATVLPLLLRNNVGGELFSVLNAGNVGIGTISPQSKLEIRNSSTINSLQIFNSTSATIPAFLLTGDGRMGLSVQTPAALIDIRNNSNYDNVKISDAAGNIQYIQQKSGRVGIGVSNPAVYNSTLAVKGTTGTAVDIFQSATSGWDGMFRFYGPNSQGQVTVRHVITDDHTTNKLIIHPGFFGNAVSVVKIEGNEEISGSLRIGNTQSGASLPNAKFSSYKLSVDGQIAAKEIVVQINSWADTVFSETYRLKPLAEVEEYIQQNNHLPDIQSENEIIENGIGLGEMNKTLLQKIEELTLYAIDLHKELMALKSLKNRKSKTGKY